jgi:UDP-N-acetylglucosamine 2-epimerase (non-hydrolysing)
MKVACIVGTRPEAIKLAPVILELKRSEKFEVLTICSGQHEKIAREMLDYFGVRIDAFLNDVMSPGQSLARLTAKMIERLDQCFSETEPDIVLVQGDTTTVLSAGMAAFYRDIKIGHIEAGLRTGNMRRPFPEEMNRSVLARLAHWHFCPTEGAAKHLRAEGVSDERIAVTGNTVIDALQIAVEKEKKAGARHEKADATTQILLTLHRRENFGEPAKRIFEAVRAICEAHPHLQFVYPVHPNPAIRGLAQDHLGDVPGVRMVEPLEYSALVTELMKSRLVLTDSGGLQEEAPALGKPVLVLREETERPEAVECGAALLVGADSDRICTSVRELLVDGPLFQSMSRARNPFGDGTASRKIRETLERSI